MQQKTFLFFAFIYNEDANIRSSFRIRTRRADIQPKIPALWGLEDWKITVNEASVYISLSQ